MCCEVTIEKAKLGANGRSKFWVKYHIDQSGQWVTTNHLKIPAPAKSRLCPLRIKSQQLGLDRVVSTQCRSTHCCRLVRRFAVVNPVLSTGR